MLNDINPENVRAAIEYTLENGVYSQGGTGFTREYCQPQHINPGKRIPNTVRPWEIESASYRCLSGDVNLVREKWQGTMQRRTIISVYGSVVSINSKREGQCCCSYRFAQRKTMNNKIFINKLKSGCRNNRSYPACFPSVNFSTNSRKDLKMIQTDVAPGS